jgi:hypothetical protein
MITPDENYEQKKLNSEEKQIVILNQAQTGETDEQDPKFHEDESAEAPAPDPDRIAENDGLDGEGIDERLAGLHTDVESSTDLTSSDENPGLNHSPDDDISLNKPDEGIF